ncbi:hypothetical protein N7E81_07395 [Reichenbachiella carrageenanivorans]|uniref:Uncharacterized protein n=1 Tax=Reichenbachiella carrageenanivorans TaxID=2979869 RepID=A0ABY6D446_9BACT|nr:hypothetical protein [Reichenbachiella carrageenanivorans]UXX80922.1 hypothetical protein N7E81_07395 [Reichenbachiella carrageenanivorans]
MSSTFIEIHHPMNIQKIISLVTITILFSQTNCATRSTMSASEDLFLTGSVISCSHLVIYQLSEDNKSYIQVYIDTKKVTLESTNHWDLSQETDGVIVRLRKFDQDISTTLCNDVIRRIKTNQEEFVATAGVLQLTLTDGQWQEYQAGGRYKADITAQGLDFNQTNTYQVLINQASVGWLPG